MNRLLLLPLLLLALAQAACSGCDDGTGQGDPDAGAPDASPDAGDPGYLGCADTDQAFVRNAYLAVLGHRPLGQAQVDVYTDLMTEARALGADAPDPRELVVRALARDPAYVDRWADHLMDALRVPRIEDQSMESCYGRSTRELDDGALAAHVRDNPATASDDGNGRFSMLDLVRSSLVLDDVTPVYRAHLFALVSRAIPAANVPRVQAELARREDFGMVFDSAYLNRDIVCLGCHNSEGAVTYDPDPAKNRHWALPGLVEKAVYGDSIGIEPERAHAMFRYDGFVADFGDSSGSRPWGWDPSCGVYRSGNLPVDPAGIDGRFASLSGDKLTVYDLEAALARGVASIKQHGLQVGDGGEIADPDAAFAYMVAASVVESVWREVIGTPLTIANYFARNEAQRDVLYQLTEAFVASDFSLQTLLVEITLTPYFNRKAPEEGCGEGPYSMPPIYDPWVIEDAEPARRNNGPGDAVVALSGRTLMRTAYQALAWPKPRFQSFPERPSEVFYCQQFGLSCSQMNNYCQSQGYCCIAYDLLCANPPGPNEPSASSEQLFQRGVGVFLKNGERGFRGLDFQARLVWEDRFGACAKPGDGDDFIDQLLALAEPRNASVRDLVAAVKDRLVGEPTIDETPVGDTSERAGIEALFGADITDPATAVSNLEAKLRAFCGVLMSSPQFVLGGLAPRGGDVPLLTPDEVSYPTTCDALADRGLPGGLTLTCDGDSLTVTR